MKGTRFGYLLDVKSSPVYFYTQRSTSYARTDSNIPFEVERLNIGGAMNVTSGTFIAPKPGTYHFSLSGINDAAKSGAFYASLQLNGVNVGRCTACPNQVGVSWFTYALGSNLKLNKGDRITLFLILGELYDDHNLYTHFTGWMLEEDLSLT